MNIADLFNLVNKMNTLIDEGIERDSSLEEVNSTLFEEFGMEEENVYHSEEEFHAEWDLCEKMCEAHDNLIAGNKINHNM